MAHWDVGSVKIWFKASTDSPDPFRRYFYFNIFCKINVYKVEDDKI